MKSSFTIWLAVARLALAILFASGVIFPIGFAQDDAEEAATPEAPAEEEDMPPPKKEAAPFADDPEDMPEPPPKTPAVTPPTQTENVPTPAEPKPEEKPIETPAYRDRADLSYYVDRNGRERPLRDAGDFHERRKHILERMQVVMGRVPGNDKRVPLEMKVLEEELVGGIIRQKIEYTTEPGDRVRAWLMVPSAESGKRATGARIYYAGQAYNNNSANAPFRERRGNNTPDSYVDYATNGGRRIKFEPYVIRLSSHTRRPSGGSGYNYRPQPRHSAVIKTRVEPTVRATRESGLPAVLCLHQTNGKLGKDEPAGLGGNENLHYALELAKRGFVTLTPDYPSFGEHEFDFKNEKSGWKSGTMKAIWDNMRAIDLLQSLDVVDDSRIGCIGHSLGGHNSIFTAAFDDRIKAVVSCCGFTRFHKYYEGKLAGWTSDRYMPAIREVYHNNPDEVPFDFPEIIASFAPRAFLAVAPQKDSNFEITGVTESMAQAKKIYAMYNASDKIEGDYPNAAHDFPPASRVLAYRFLEKHLDLGR